MSQKPSVLMINEYGLYPEFISAIRDAGYPLTVEHLMRNAIKRIKRDAPAIVVAEFAHESHFRDRVSNLESMLAQVERSRTRPRTLVFYDAAKRPYLDRLLEIFRIDRCLEMPVSGEALVSEIEALSGR